MVAQQKVSLRGLKVRGNFEREALAASYQ